MEDALNDEAQVTDTTNDDILKTIDAKLSALQEASSDISERLNKIEANTAVTPDDTTDKAEKSNEPDEAPGEDDNDDNQVTEEDKEEAAQALSI